MLRTNTFIGTHGCSYRHPTQRLLTKNSLVGNVINRPLSNVNAGVQVSIYPVSTMPRAVKLPSTDLVPLSAFVTILGGISRVLYNHRNAVLNGYPAYHLTQPSRYPMDFSIGFDSVMDIGKPIQILNCDISIIFLGNINNLMGDLINPGLGEVGLIIGKILNPAFGLEFSSPNLELPLSRCDIPTEIEGTDNLLLHRVVNHNSGEIGRSVIDTNDIPKFSRLFDIESLGEYNLNSPGFILPDEEKRIEYPSIIFESQEPLITAILLNRDGDALASLHTLHTNNINYGISFIRGSEPHGSVIISNWDISGSVLLSAGEYFSPCAFKDLRGEFSIFPHSMIGQVMQIG